MSNTVSAGLAMVSPKISLVLGWIAWEIVSSSARIDPDALDAEPFQRNSEQVHCAAVDGRDGNNAVAGAAQIQHGQQRRCLSAGGEHCAHAAFQGCDLLLDSVAGGVGETGVHRLHGHIEQLCHLFGAVKAIGGTLYDGDSSRTAVFRGIAGVNIWFPVLRSDCMAA